MGAISHFLIFCVILPHCYLYVVSQECNTTLLIDMKPIHLSVEIKGRVLNLSWNCGFPPEIIEEMEYEIYLKYNGDYKYKYGTRNCYKELTLETIAPVCLKVIPTIKEEECHELSSEKCINLERNRTSAENVSCRVYNTSSMICTWKLGKNVSPNTSYILSLRQGTTRIQCQEYKKHFQQRTDSCTFHDLSVHFFEDSTIVLQDSDHGTEVFVKHIRLSHIEVFNPPRDISVTSFGGSITISWHSPETQYDASDECFKYIIEKNQDLYDATTNSLEISHIEKECQLRIRAKGKKKCDINTHWGEWSEWILCGSPSSSTDHRDEVPLKLISVILISGLILFISLIIILQYKRVMSTCFPPIPEPKNYFESTEDCKVNLKNFDYFSPILPKSETEECIVIKENGS